jgi:hypothetical protein
VVVGKIITGTFVKVGSGVNVFLSVGAKVGESGTASSVLVNAALDVCTIIVLMAFESSGGTDVTAEGTHAKTSVSAKDQMKNFPVEFFILQQSL